MTTGDMEFTEIYGGEPAAAKRPLLRSMQRGFMCRCPNCGDGKLFSGYAKTVETCSVCGEDIHHHRADDFPAYVNIFIVGHVIVGALLLVDRSFTLSPWTQMAIWVPLTLIMVFALLQPIKGAVVGLQWANRMHGFGGEEDTVADPDIDPASHG